MKRQKLVRLLATLCLVAVSVSGCLDPIAGLEAIFSASEIEHVIPFTASFDATLTYSSDGKVVSYFWNFGDGGSSDAGPVVDHIYQQDGVYEVTLTVLDSEGRTDKVSMTIHALNPLPLADFTYAPKSVMEDKLIISASEWVTFDASTSTDDGEIVSYHWYFGREDSGEAMVAEGPEIKCRYRDAGTYSIVLTVTDNDGGSSTCVQQVEVVGSQACNADLCEEYPWLYVE
ncbi:PKD domain-containing protein [Candidatus Bipolaricaulota bacterium]|nr:PKD domain-containing protein [Candidatus Bipolaricaulota bacterium]